MKTTKNNHEERMASVIANVLKTGYVGTWKDLRNEILASKKLDHLWPHEDFRWGVQLLCYTIEGQVGGNKEEGNIAELFLTDAHLGCRANLNAIHKLLEALAVIEPVFYEQEDVRDIRFDLQMIARCIEEVLDSVAVNKKAA